MFGLEKAVTRGRTVVDPTARLIRPGLSGFKQFLMRGNIVDLAVAVVIGTAFTAVVTSLVKNIFTPLIAAGFGQPDFAKLTFTINGSTFYYGEFINSVVAFLSVAAVIYFVVVMPLAKLAERRRRGQEASAEASVLSDEAKLLTEIRDLLAEERRRVTHDRAL